ncbi:MAG: P-loop NTPase [Steroidobacteraceae bacterium]
MSIIEQALKRFHSERQPGAESDAKAPLGVVHEIAAQGEPTAGKTVRPARRIVHIDRTALTAAGFLPPDHKQRQIGDQFRHVKRPLLSAALGRGREALTDGRLIMLTSSMPEEGKTFVSVNLAISMSLEREVNVVLVDADVAKPHVSRLFGIEAEPGLLEAVQDETLEIESLILPTSIPKLSVLSAGAPIETATELLTSQRMEAVVGKLGVGDLQRVVIFDSPPLLLTSESRALAHHMGQIVLVVRAGMTPRHAVLDAIHCLDASKSIALVLNQSDNVAEAGYHYGEYGRDFERHALEQERGSLR